MATDKKKEGRERKPNTQRGGVCARTCDVPVGGTCMCVGGRRGHLVSLLSVGGAGGGRARGRGEGRACTRARMAMLLVRKQCGNCEWCSRST